MPVLLSHRREQKHRRWPHIGCEQGTSTSIRKGLHSVLQLFEPDLLKNSFGKKICYQCHTLVTAKDFIFTSYARR